jgi:hypothetical protein
VDASSQLAASANRRFEFHKRSQLFIRVHNETVSAYELSTSEGQE